MATPSSQALVFIDAIKKFKDSLNQSEKDRFDFATLDDLQGAIAEIEKKHGSEKKMRNMARLRRFLEAMTEYGKIIEVFVNCSNFVAFIWGPMKFLLQVSHTYVQAFDALLEMYTSIGEHMPLLLQYETIFKEKPHMKRVLELIYIDILEFHSKAVRYFQGRVWRQLFHATWKTFQSKFSAIIENFRRHRTLMESQANILQFEQLEIVRAEQESKFKEIRKDEEKKKTIMIREWLGVANPEVDQETFSKIRKEYPGTGRWILQKRHIQTWLDPFLFSTILLWLNGIPGAGKTMLASLIIEEARKVQSSVVLFFYCKYRDVRRDSLLAIASNLLWQILQYDQMMHQDGALLAFFYEKAYSSGGNSIQSMSEAGAMLSLAFERFEKTYIILDGLDECQINEKRLISNWFIEAVEKASQTEPGSLRCLFVSQDDNDCNKLFRNLPTISITSSDNQPDILAFCHSWEKKIKQKFPRLHEASSIATRVAENADSMFLFAKLVMSNLLNQTSLARLKLELSPNRFPKGIEDAYDRIIDRVLVNAVEPESEDAKKLLGLLVASRRPLRWHEIQGWFSVDLQTRSIEFDERELCVDSKDLCGSLLEIGSGGLIKFVHTTARQYLINQKIIAVEQEEYNLTALCLCYLSHACFDLYLSEDDLEEYVLNGCYAFADYSFCYWVEHLENCSRSLEYSPNDAFVETITTEVDRFLAKHNYITQSSYHTSKSTSTGLAIFERQSSAGNLVNAIKFWKEMVQNKHIHTDGISVLDLHDVLTDIRSSIDLMAKKADLEVQEQLHRYHGSRIFKCTQYSCEFFHGGFKTVQERDKHQEMHELPYVCTFSECPRAILGFRSYLDLEAHLEVNHDTQKPVEFPVASEPGTINLLEAIKTENLTAVERWAAQFPGYIPLTSSGIWTSVLGHEKSSEMFLDVACKSKNLRILEFLFDKIDHSSALISQTMYRIVYHQNKHLWPWIISVPVENEDPRATWKTISLPIKRGDDTGALQLLRRLKTNSPSLHYPKEGYYVTIAAEFGCIRCLNFLLLECQLDANAVDLRGRTPLIAAVTAHNPGMVKLLIRKHHCDVDYETKKEKQTALSVAIANGFEDIVHILAPYLASLDRVEEALKTCRLRRGSRDGNLEEIQQLLSDSLLPIHVPNNDGYTPFLDAVENGHESIVETFLTTHGDLIDLNLKCDCHHPAIRTPSSKRQYRGATALIIATINEHTAIVQRILGASSSLDTEAKVHIKKDYVAAFDEKKNCNALEIAKARKATEIVDLIENYIRINRSI